MECVVQESETANCLAKMADLVSSTSSTFTVVASVLLGALVVAGGLALGKFIIKKVR